MRDEDSVSYTKRSRGASAPIVCLTKDVQLPQHERWLETFGFRIVHAGSDEHAVDAIRALAPRLVLVSVTSSDIEIEAFIRAVRRDPHAPQPVIVVLSDGVIAEDQLRAMGVDAVLINPVSGRGLRDALRSLLTLPVA
jgi:CheY-like chemotaxis protein